MEFAGDSFRCEENYQVRGRNDALFAKEGKNHGEGVPDRIELGLELNLDE